MGRVLDNFLTINDHHLIILGHRRGWILAETHDGIQQDILLPVGITLA
jgi:hypothetical protein